MRLVNQSGDIAVDCKARPVVGRAAKTKQTTGDYHNELPGDKRPGLDARNLRDLRRAQQIFALRAVAELHGGWHAGVRGLAGW